jgi:hypothetical protein
MPKGNDLEGDRIRAVSTEGKPESPDQQIPPATSVKRSATGKMQKGSC